MARFIQVLAIVVIVGLFGFWWFRQERAGSLNKQDAPSAARETVKTPAEGPRPVVKTAEKPAIELDRAEARGAVMALAEENARLRKEVLALREKIRTLTHPSASEVAQRAVPRENPKTVSEASPRVSRGGPYKSVGVVDVNHDLHLVVLDAGSEAGLVAGMDFRLYRGDRPGPRIRVVDVRPHVAGAVLREAATTYLPEAGDRAVPIPPAGSE